MKKIFYLLSISILYLFSSCNNEDIPFLKNGFEAGKSYYFDLKTN